jgi:hypothetical protein
MMLAAVAAVLEQPLCDREAGDIERDKVLRQKKLSCRWYFPQSEIQ